MGIQVVVSGKVCDAAACTLLSGLREIPGVDGCVPWAAWQPTAADADGVFIVLGGELCEPDHVFLHRWYTEFLDLTTRCPRVRLWPIILVSPHAERWIRDLQEATGLNLHVEFKVQLATLAHDATTTGPSAQLCESDATNIHVPPIIHRLLLTAPWRLAGNIEGVRGNANLRQACSVLDHRASKLHYEVHDIRSHGVQPSPRASIAHLESVGEDLKRFVAGVHVEEFVALGRAFLDSVSDKQMALSTLATYMEESAGSLRCAVDGFRRKNRSRVLALVVDDDPSFADAVVRGKPSNAPVEATTIALPTDHILARIRGLQNCGGDPSEAVAEIVHGCLVRELDRLHARDEWIIDGTRFVVVADIRLDPKAPAGGLGVIRRVRNTHPFVATIALTVRRGLVYDLADEGVDAYVVKSPDNAETIRVLWQAIESATWHRDTYYCYPGTEDVVEDIYLAELLQRRYLLTPANEGDLRALRLAFCTPEKLAEVSNAVPPNAAIALVVGCDFDPGTSLKLLCACRDTWRRKAVLVRRVPRTGRPIRVYPSSVLGLDRAMQTGAPTKFDTRWTLLVPRIAQWGDVKVAVDEKHLASFRQAVATRFGGATADEAHGVWLRPRDALEVKDELERVEVLGRSTESARNYLLDLAHKVVSDLGQEEVFLQEHGVRNWSLGPTHPPDIPSALQDTHGRIAIPFSATAVLPPEPPSALMEDSPTHRISTPTGTPEP